MTTISLIFVLPILLLAVPWMARKVLQHAGVRGQKAISGMFSLTMSAWLIWMLGTILSAVTLPISGDAAAFFGVAALAGVSLFVVQYATE